MNHPGLLHALTTPSTLSSFSTTRLPTAGEAAAGADAGAAGAGVGGAGAGADTSMGAARSTRDRGGVFLSDSVSLACVPTTS